MADAPMGDANGELFCNSVEHKHDPTNTKLLRRVVQSLLLLCQLVVFEKLKNKRVKPCHRRM
jgi:hypothetical protein